MANELVGAVSVNPDEVVYWLQLADFTYPRNRDADPVHGWSKFAVIPGLYNWTAQHRRFPSAAEGVQFLMDKCEAPYKKDPGVVNRAHKLYMDFAREMHTMGLLQRCPILGYVEYQKALDLGFNVDYIASVVSYLLKAGHTADSQVGIQAAMRAQRIEGGDPWDLLKQARRSRRGSKEWEGKLYLISNRERDPWRKVNGCWLFGPDHIKDLANEIKTDHNAAKDEPDPVLGVQLNLFD